MTTRVDTTDSLRSALPAPRGLSRVDVAVSAAGVLVYSFVIWLMVFALLPMAFGLSPTVISSGSMTPLLREGDVVLTSDHPGTGLGPGTVILFQTEGAASPVMHRIVSVEPDGSYRTRGDANASVDSTPVRPDDVKGVARLLVPYAGLPAHWLRVGAWLHLAGFVAGITLVAAMARRRPRTRVTARSAGPTGRWTAYASLVGALTAAIALTAVEMFRIAGRRAPSQRLAARRSGSS